MSCPSSLPNAHAISHGEKQPDMIFIRATLSSSFTSEERGVLASRGRWTHAANTAHFMPLLLQTNRSSLPGILRYGFHGPPPVSQPALSSARLRRTCRPSWRTPCILSDDGPYRVGQRRFRPRSLAGWGRHGNSDSYALGTSLVAAVAEEFTAWRCCARVEKRLPRRVAALSVGQGCSSHEPPACEETDREPLS